MWKTAAEECMLSAAKEEADAARLRENLDSTVTPTIPVEADCCWSKRSYKNQYNALSGVAAIIGHHTGKVLHIGVRNKYCVICARAKSKNKEPAAHKCTKNHLGSSSSMEQQILVEGFKSSVETRGLIYNPLIADGDASTYKNILESRPYPGVPIQKIECTNHLLRNYNGKNLSLKIDTSIPLIERKLFTPERMTRLRTAVRSSVRHWESQSLTESDKIIKIQKDILNSPKHIFGSHKDCEAYYCTEERKKEEDITTKVKALMLKLEKNVRQLAIHSRSLLKNFNTNRAEQFNSVVAKTVGGKRINFSLKDSYSARCYAAVVSFNTGKPQTTLYKSIFDESPGKSLQKFEETRFNNNEYRKRKIPTRSLVATNAKNVDYGKACQKPDMSTEDYEQSKSIFLDSLKKQASNRHDIERETILQAESALWLELRRCILTASNFAKICKRRPNLNSAPLVKSLLYSYSLDHVPAIKHGKENEETAIQQLSRQENINIEKCGLFIDEDHCFLGASPDGLYKDGIVEIKCPISIHGMDIDDAINQKKIKCFKTENGRTVINPNHDWHFQIQGQLHITKKDVCLFAVWAGPELPMKAVKVYKDDDFWAQKMLPKLSKFYFTCVVPEIVDPRKSRSMPLRDIVL
ncbi:yqaJ-like viral recombinase domain-containing protein [Phthorimaea operculella]|nr:yqaJ-like viral recombinase domain-containing protein [Phthorimaea operculella]